MKLKNIFILFALALGTCAFVACGDEEQDPSTQGENAAAKAIVGTYEGWTHLESTFINKNYTGDTFALALAQDGTLTATFINQVWGTATIKGIRALEIPNEGYSFTGGEGSFVMNDVRQGGTQEFPCLVGSGTVSSDLKTLQVVIIANMTVAGGHGEMTFLFQTGEMPTAE